MKPRQSKLSSEPRTMIALSQENEYLRTKQSEQVETIEKLNKQLDVLRSQNVDLAKNVETNNANVKIQNNRIFELSKECLIAKASITRLERKVSDSYDVSLEMRKAFLACTNSMLQLNDIFERNDEGDLTLGRDDHMASMPSPSKSPMKAVQPMISGHIIQNPTISISKSDSQHINYLIRRRNDSGHESNRLVNSPNSAANVSNNSNNSSSDTLQNIANTSDENIGNTLLNGDVYNNENDSAEQLENTNGSVPYYRRLSTVLEISTLQQTLTNNTNAFVNSILLEPELSKNSTNSSNSSGKSKKRALIMPSPIETVVKNPRRSWQQISYRNKSNNSTQNSVSSIGMSTRGSSSRLQSAFTSEDPLEGPSTLLDQENDFVAFSTSTPVETQKRIGKKSVINTPVAADNITTRKTRNLKTSVSTKNNSSGDKLNLSKSLNDLSELDTEIKSSANTKNKKKKIGTSTFQRSENNNSEIAEINTNSSNNTLINESPPKKQLPNKKGRVTRVKNASKSIVSRKSRSYSPNYRSQNDDSNYPEMPLTNRDENLSGIAASCVNPIVKLERMSKPRKAKNKRRSRSFSPQGSEKSDESEVSTRSSTRNKNIVNYFEPSLKTKIRRK